MGTHWPQHPPGGSTDVWPSGQDTTWRQSTKLQFGWHRLQHSPGGTDDIWPAGHDTSWAQSTRLQSRRHDGQHSVGSFVNTKPVAHFIALHAIRGHLGGIGAIIALTPLLFYMGWKYFIIQKV